ncbi:MAG: hypothetical protein VKL39_12230 [Leptolyngbyaceae bacterium]|nr:hypothetical protein [Leptolyngbyaceae bacterium]
MDEFRSGLELATDDELTVLTEVLFRPRFNPIDYAIGKDPFDVRCQDRHQWLDDIEQRFRFLAADGMTILRGESHLVGYRSILMRLCRYLNVHVTPSMPTLDIEAEVFLHVLERAWDQLPENQRVLMTKNVTDSLQRVSLAHPVPPALQRDPIRLMLKGSGIVMVNSVIRPWLLQQIARQFAIQAATYQAAQRTLVKGGVAIATHWQSRVAAQMAKRGMAVSAARYGAARSVLAVVGPALWIWFFADLGWRAIATNYYRVIPCVFTLAQIRLLRYEALPETTI